MYVLIVILAFINGAALASCFFIANKNKVQDKAEPETAISRNEEAFVTQMSNMLNYTGSKSGQTEVKRFADKD